MEDTPLEARLVFVKHVLSSYWVPGTILGALPTSPKLILTTTPDAGITIHIL